MSQLFFPDWREKVVFSPDGVKPQVLLETNNFKVLIGGLEAGQQIPTHPEGAAVFHFLEGSGWMVAGEERFAVKPGVTIVVPAGANRGIQAETRLAFLAARVASED